MQLDLIVTTLLRLVLSLLPIQDNANSVGQRVKFTQRYTSTHMTFILSFLTITLLYLYCNFRFLTIPFQSFQRLSRKNGVKDEESSWYWDPPAQAPKSDEENRYEEQIRALQDEIFDLRQRDTIALRPDGDELHRLREENKNLSSSLDDLDNQHQQAMERLLSLKKELQKNFEVLKQEHEDLQNSNDEYAALNQQLSAKLSERDREIENIKAAKADFDTLHHKYINLEKVHSMLRDNAEKFQEENQELHEEIFKLQEQVTKLEHEIEIDTKHSELSNTVPRERYDELLRELNETKDRRNLNQVHLDEINIDDNAKSVIENLKRDINELKHKLSQKESDDQDSGDHKIVKSDKVMQLYNKYINFEIPVDYIGEMPSSHDNIVLFKLESVFKTVNSFRKEIDMLEHKISEKNLNINHLQTQIDDLTTENDFLNTDLQHYEGELNEMKKNNDFLISELAALKNTSKLEPIIETHEDNLAKLETELDNCNRINKSFESEIKRIEKELAEVKTEKTVLQESLSDLRSKYTVMLNEFETCATQTKAIVELENSAQKGHDEKLKKFTDEIDDLKKRLHASNAKNEQQSIDIHIIENDKVLLTKEVDDLKHTLEEKSSALNELISLNANLDQKLKNLEKQLDEVFNHKKGIESEKIKLLEKVESLEVNSTNKSLSHAEIERLAIEKEHLVNKIDQITKENITLAETVQELTTDITNLKQKQQEVLSENHTLKNCSKSENEIKLLQQTIEELKAKIIQQEVLKNEMLQVKDENHKLTERKLQLETELASTDSKIGHLEQEFEKLITDLNEKDTIIDTLNSTVAQNNITLTALNENVAGLENSLQIKNQEIQKLTQSLKEVSDKLNDTTQKSDSGFEELKKLHTTKEEITKQLFAINEDINSKNSQISKLTNRSEELEKICNEHKATIDSKDKEIKELNQSIVELRDKIKTANNITHHNDEYAKLVQEKKTIENEVTSLKNNLTMKENELSEMKVKSDQLETACLEYTTILENATKEKTDIINLITLKHNESIQYHNEIQRLNHVLLEQTNEFKKAIEEKDKLIQNSSESCSNCARLRITLKEKDEINMSLHQNATQYEQMKSELMNASDTVRSLTERCENLDRSLAIQLENVKKLTAENLQVIFHVYCFFND